MHGFPVTFEFRPNEIPTREQKDSKTRAFKMYTPLLLPIAKKSTQLPKEKLPAFMERFFLRCAEKGLWEG